MINVTFCRTHLKICDKSGNRFFELTKHATNLTLCVICKFNEIVAHLIDLLCVWDRKTFKAGYRLGDTNVADSVKAHHVFVQQPQNLLVDPVFAAEKGI